MTTSAPASPASVLAEIAQIDATSDQATTLVINAQTSLTWAEQMRPKEAEQEILEQLQAISTFACHADPEAHEIGQKALVCMEALKA